MAGESEVTHSWVKKSHSRWQCQNCGHKVTSESKPRTDVILFRFVGNGAYRMVSCEDQLLWKVMGQ